MMTARTANSCSSSSRPSFIWLKVWMSRPSSWISAKPTSRIRMIRCARLFGRNKDFIYGARIVRAWSVALYRRRQHIAAAAHGLDELGIAPVILQLAAQARHGHIDGAVERPGLAAA